MHGFGDVLWNKMNDLIREKKAFSLMSTVTIMSYLRLNLTYISLPLRNNVSLGSLNKALQRRWAFDPYIQIL